MYHSDVKRQPLQPIFPLLLSLALITAAPPFAPAQQDSARILPAQQDSARLSGSVRSSLNGLPISGVMIAVQGSRVFDVSNSVGLFALAGLPSGRQTLRVLYGDSLSYEKDIMLQRGQTLMLAVLLEVEALELTPIVVEAQSARAVRSLAGFYDRKTWGRFGRFYTLQELQQRRGLPLRSLLSEAGVWVGCGTGYCIPLGSGGPRQCLMSLYLDGMRLLADEISLIRVDELAGVEVYKRGFDVPLEFQWGSGSSCGAVLVWRRY